MKIAGKDKISEPAFFFWLTISGLPAIVKEQISYDKREKHLAGQAIAPFLEVLFGVYYRPYYSTIL